MPKRGSRLQKAALRRATQARETYTRERCYLAETWNSGEDPALSVARARVAPGVSTVRHYLDVDERYLIASGSGRVEVQGLAAQEVSAGDVVVIPAGRRQRIENPGTEDLVFYCLCTPRFVPECYHEAEEAHG